MTLDLTTTYFPHADRDNFGKPFGQNMYNWEWFIGDRTSIISYGWFEFWELTGDPLTKPAIDRRNNPFGLNIITTGISISRPPRTNLFIGYTVIDTGVITTSALNSSISYWLSPKWYGTYATSYDFGYDQLLAANFSVTRIGADYLMSVGLSIDPQRESYMFAVELQPRISPNIRFGSTAGMNQLRLSIRADPMTRFDPAHGPASKGREDHRMIDEIAGTAGGGSPTGSPTSMRIWTGEPPRPGPPGRVGGTPARSSPPGSAG